MDLNIFVCQKAHFETDFDLIAPKNSRFLHLICFIHIWLLRGLGKQLHILARLFFRLCKKKCGLFYCITGKNLRSYPDILPDFVKNLAEYVYRNVYIHIYIYIYIL